MSSFDKFLDTFINGDLFVIFLALMLIILVVLIIALIKSREDYKELLDFSSDNDILMNELNKKSHEKIEVEDDLLSSLVANNEEDKIVEDKPLIKQIDTKKVKTYDDLIDEYELSEEENAVISTEELMKKTKERTEELGESVNASVIAKYEEEQENKAIISYEQLLKNASNISLSYKEEAPQVSPEAPKIQKIEVEEKEVTPAVSYLAEEEFLKILKDFRMSLE